MDYFDQIEEYLNDALSESDKIAFEEAMANDLELKQAVEDHGLAMDVVGSILEGEVRKVIEGQQLTINNEQLIIDNGGEESGNINTENGNISILREGVEKQTQVRKMNWVRWVVAASVVFILGFWGINQLSDNNNSKLYAVTYSDPTWPLERGQDSVEMYNSISKYFNGSKKEAKFELKSYSTVEADYWLSEIYYKEMKFDSTLLMLASEINSSNDKRRDRINYLRILSLYFMGDKIKTKEFISKLPLDTDNYYKLIYSRLNF